MYFFPNFEPVCGSMSGSNYCFLTCIQISQEAGNMLCYSCLFKNFPQFVLFQTIKGFRVVNEADVFLEFSCIFCDAMDVGSLISGSSAFSNSSLNIWKFLVHVLLKTGLENFEHYFASIWMECSCVSVNILCLALLGMKTGMKLIFSSPVATAQFSILLANWVQHFKDLCIIR